MHPETALSAWSELQAEETGPRRVEILKDRNASHVYRLANAFSDGSSVVAKRCLKVDALAEQLIYQEVLRYLPFRTLRYYGLVEEPGTEFCWVFVEDAGGVPYSPSNPQHGRLAAAWLAGLHTYANTPGGALHLQERGPDLYLSFLRSGRERIQGSLGNPALNDDERRVLLGIVEQCNAVEAEWHLVEECCRSAAPTLVHADLHAKNIHVSPDGQALLPFDWESAGWGPPAVDLGLPGLELHTYWTGVHRHRPELQLNLVAQLARAGRLFQLLAHIAWEATGLASSPWLHRPMKHMRYYLAEMAQTLGPAQAIGGSLAVDRA
jgi:hypothetical protein